MMSGEDAGLLPLSATELLSACVGRRLTSLVRYDAAPKEHFAQQTGLPKRRTFSMSDGPAEFGFENKVSIIVNMSSKLGSVLVVDGRSLRQPLRGSPDYFPIDAIDPEFSEPEISSFVGCAVKSVGVLTRRSKRVILVPLPYQIALVYSFEGGKRVAAETPSELKHAACYRRYEACTA